MLRRGGGYVNDIKTAVKEHYGALAAEGSCCGDGASGSSCCCASASSPPLGCGIPLRHAGLRRGETVLDLGCGPGIEVLAAARAVGPEGRVIGVDMTPEMVEAARARTAGAQARVDILLADIESLPLEPETVDVIVSNCVINLAPDKRRGFAEMARVLVPGGRFSVSDMVTRGAVPEELRANPELWAGCVSGAIDEEEYLCLMREAGLEGVQVASATDYGRLGDSECTLRSITVTGAKGAAAGR